MGANEEQFNEEEVAAIVRRAAGLQASSRDHVPATEGLNEEQLLAASAEMGIGAEFVRAAIQEKAEVASMAERSPFWGGPVETRVDRVFEGNVSNEEWAVLLADLRSCTRTHGNVTSQQGGVIEWNVGDLSTMVMLVQQSGQTRVLVTSRTSELRALFYVAFGFLPVLVAIGTGGTSVMAFIVSTLLTLMLALGLARQATTRVSRKRRRQAFAIAKVVEKFLLSRSEGVVNSVENSEVEESRVRKHS